MSRMVIGYVQGRPIYRDEGPGHARMPGYGGSLVVGGSISSDPAKRAEYQRRHTRKVREERCGLAGPCRHAPCVAERAAEAERLYRESNLTLAQIGVMLGGRAHTTVSNLLRIADRVA